MTTNRTPESIIADYLYDPDQGAEPQERAEREAKAIIANLKYEGFIVTHAGDLAKNISQSMAGVAHGE